MEKKENYSQHSSNVNNEIASKEREYVQENLTYYIQKNAIYERKSHVYFGFSVEADYQTRLRTLLLDHILKHFTLWDLYSIFFKYQSCYYLEEGIIRESKQVAIACINEDESLSIQESRRLKKKVWDMNPILFGLIHEFIHESDLFWDEIKEEIVLPDFAQIYPSA